MTEFLKTWFKKRAFYNNNNNNNNKLCFTRVAHNVKRLTNPWPSNSRSNWNLEILIFVEGGKPGNRRKTLGARTKTNDKLIFLVSDNYLILFTKNFYMPGYTPSIFVFKLFTFSGQEGILNLLLLNLILNEICVIRN